MRQLERLDPNLALAAAAVAIVATEAAYRTWISDAWLLLEALVAAAALFHAWREQDRLRLAPVLAVIGGLQLALFGVHLALDVVGDKDSSVVYRWQGNGLDRGDYPRSEYPLGAVLLFGLEAWLGGGTTRNANALLMVAAGGADVGGGLADAHAVCALACRADRLLAANAFYWQYKFDLAPAALLAVGLVLALRGRWGLSGVALAVGTLVKWTPALAAVALVAWLLTTRRVREAATHAAAFAGTILLVYVPFLLWSRVRGARRVRAPERALDHARVRLVPPASSVRPRARADAHLVLCRRPELGERRGRARCRSLSCSRSSSPRRVRARSAPRSLSPRSRPSRSCSRTGSSARSSCSSLFAAWALAAALVVRTRREQLWVGVAMATAALANEFVYPFALPRYDYTWVACSFILFATGLGLTGWLAVRAR